MQTEDRYIDPKHCVSPVLIRQRLVRVILVRIAREIRRERNPRPAYVEALAEQLQDIVGAWVEAMDDRSRNPP